MKTTLLFAFIIASFAANAQSVAGFYTVNTVTGDHYSVVTSDTDLDESTAGASMTWNFNQLADAGTSITNVNAPTSAEVTTYPTTTGVVATVFEADGTTTNIYFSSTANGVSVTGAEASGFVLNYSTNNAYLGLFPLAYGYSNSDTVAGSFTSSVLSGTFTGTSVTSVDAYGTLSANIGGSWASGTAVTRLKIVQNLNLIYLGTTIGTVTQTTYQYYNNDGSAAPLFRSITTHVVLPAFSVDDTTSSLESYEETLGTANVEASDTLAIAPNPVGDVLHFAGDATVTGITIIDASGRVVLQSKSANDIVVSNLSAGIYYVTVRWASGSTIQKMVKK